MACGQKGGHFDIDCDASCDSLCLWVRLADNEFTTVWNLTYIKPALFP